MLENLCLPRMSSINASNTMCSRRPGGPTIQVFQSWYFNDEIFGTRKTRLPEES